MAAGHLCTGHRIYSTRIPVGVGWLYVVGPESYRHQHSLHTLAPRVQCGACSHMTTCLFSSLLWYFSLKLNNQVYGLTRLGRICTLYQACLKKETFFYLPCVKLLRLIHNSAKWWQTFVQPTSGMHPYNQTIFWGKTQWALTLSPKSATSRRARQTLTPVSFITCWFTDKMYSYNETRFPL